MTSIPFAFYDAFSEIAFGGSQAGVVSDASKLDKTTRQQIATEIGAPATAFVTADNEGHISARFHSPLTEYGMCGHGTICMMTRLVEQGVLCWDETGHIDVDLHLRSSIAPVHIIRREDGRPEVLLDITPPKLRQQDLDQTQLTSLLGLCEQDIEQDMPLEIAFGDFVHLIVPLRDLDAMNRIIPNFPGLIQFCKQVGLQTIAVFCTEVEGAGSDVHVRDFCPAVGVPESAGTGTTNAALAAYLIRHGNLQAKDENRQILVQAEQGLELGRPGIIRSVVTLGGGVISRLQVGGVATKIIEGKLFLPG